MAEFNREEIDYEDQLRQSERERKDLKNIIYELPVGLITVKGGNELTIDIANHEFCRMSGYRIGGLQHGENVHGAVDPYGRLHDV